MKFVCLYNIPIFTQEPSEIQILFRNGTMDVGNQASVNFHHSRARTYLYDFFYRGASGTAGWNIFLFLGTRKAFLRSPWTANLVFGSEPSDRNTTQQRT